MNKIYKVIWSKVKHQYVVVSELAHSNGKQSRTSRNSIRSRIAALVVCGAIAAFGVFSALPMDSAYAADVNVQQATQTQYVAFRADTTSDEWRKGEKTIEGIVFRPQTIRLSDKTLNYWVREGYTLKATEGIQYIPDNLMKTDDVNGLKSDYAISAEITDQNLIKGSVLKTTESSAVGTTAMTTRNESLQKIEVGHYTGVSNSGGVGTGTIDWNYIIDPNGQGNVNEFIDIKDAAPDQWDPSQGKYVKDVWKSGYLKEVELRGSSYYLKDTNQEVASQNVYIIGDKAGAFVTTKNGSEIYTGRVYGAHNEILMTGKDENGNYYTYWAGKVNDDDNVLLSDSNLTLGDYKENVNAFYRNDRKLAAADIKSVEVDANNNGINLITNTQFDENGKPIERTEETITGFTVTSVKNTGEDTKIQFSDGENNKFDVDAGSRVVATKDEDGKVSELSINGTKYAIGGGETYTAGDGIAIATDDNNKISVNAGDGLTFETQEGEDKGKLKVNVGDGLSITNGEVVNNFKVEADKNAADGSDDNWTITDGQQKFTNTTLVNGTVEKRAIQDNAYGSDYLVKDTDGNTATLYDVASATKLKEVAGNSANINLSNITTDGQTEIKNLAKDVEKHIATSEEAAYPSGGYKVDKTAHTVTLVEANGNGVATGKNVVISDVASAEDLGNLTTKVNNGWNVSDGNDGNADFAVKPGETLTFNGDDNIDVEAKDHEVNVSLNDNITLGEGNSQININGAPEGDEPALSIGDKFVVEQNGSVSIKADNAETYGIDTTVTINPNTTLDDETFATVGRAATEEQLKQAAAASKTTLSDGVNTTVTSNDNTPDGHVDYQVNLNDNVYLGGNNKPGSSNIELDGENGTIQVGSNIILDSKEARAVIGGVDISTTFDDIGKKSSTITGLSNTTWDTDKVVIDRAATEGQLQMVSDKVTAGWTATDDAGHKINVNPNTRPTLNFASGKNITVSANEDNGEVEVSLNDVVTLGDGEDAIKIDGTNGTLNIGSTFAVAEDGTVLSDGDVIADADGEKYSLSEVGKYAVRYDKTNDGTSTITLADGDDLSGTRIKNVADGVDPKDAVNVSQLEAVEATANAGWTASDGTNSISIKPNETLNFVGDENLTVSADGTDKKLKVSLNDDITLGNTEAGNTEGERSFTINTTDPNGYVPESYKTGSGANFIEENGGFMLFATDTQGHGIFGVTTKGTAHGKDFVTYTKDIYGNDTRYSLNDVGDAVAQMSSYYNEENRKSYTVFSRYLNEAEKDNPFVTVDEDGNKINATRDIPLALRDDGAVLIGATIKGEDFTDNGIRINAETETTYDEDGNEVTNNIATITGLENTEWTPPAPVATFANEGTETSRAATEAQLNDLYGTVVGYNVDTDGVNYGTVTLGGGRTSYDKDTHEGGTVLNNVAYASGTDGSEAVNVDYLNDAINNAVKDGGAISDSDRHLQEGTYHVNDQGEVELIVADEKGENRSTVTIDNIANKNDITNLDNKIDNTFNDLNDKINNIDNVETDVKGGNINEDGTISLKTENEDGTTTNVTLKGQLTDSGVVQEGTTFDKETGTLTITSQDKYSGKTSSVTVDGIASTDVVGVTTKEELADKYKAADEDGNATTAYITESESMVEADVALDHAIQDVAGTSYANDMVLSNRIDSVEKRLGNVEERIDKVGAMAAAIANLRTMGFDPEAPTEIAIGVGQYKSETGIAIGVFHYPNQDFMLSASLSSSGDELMGGIGATWKLGRKSAAERAKDEEARHLEQAEEMKKLAQQEKVKAQAQRHAKLLAERQQASQKNA